MKKKKNNFLVIFKNIKPEKWLILVVIFALIVRLIFFMGFINADSQDEGIYINHIHEILTGRLNFYNYRNLPNNYLANPAETFKFRSMLIYPVALSVLIFGVNDFTATLYILLTSIGGIILVFYFGKLLFNEKVGLIAAFLLSIFPLDVMFATRIMPDVPQAFFSMLFIYFFLKAEKSKKKNKILKLKEDRFYYLLSGVSLGLGYLVKPLIFSLIPFLIIYIIYKRIIKINLIFLVLGFLIILSIEGVYYYFQSGNFFLNIQIFRSLYLQKYTFENYVSVSLIPKILRLSYVDSEPIYYSKLIFNLSQYRPGVNYFGYFYYLLVIAILYLLVKRVKNSYPIILFVIILMLYVECAPVGFKFNEKGFLIDYLLIFKTPRFLTILTIPVLLVISVFLTNIRKEITIVILIALIFSSIYFINQARNYFLSGVIAVREAANFLKNQPNKFVYADNSAAGILRYYLSYQRDRYIRTFPENVTYINGAFVVDGGSRGVDIYWEVIENSRPSYLNNPPKDWRLLKTIYNPMHDLDSNHRNLLIYYVPVRQP